MNKNYSIHYVYLLLISVINMTQARQALTDGWKESNYDTRNIYEYEQALPSARTVIVNTNTNPLPSSAHNYENMESLNLTQEDLQEPDLMFNTPIALVENIFGIPPQKHSLSATQLPLPALPSSSPNGGRIMYLPDMPTTASSSPALPPRNNVNRSPKAPARNLNGSLEDDFPSSSQALGPNSSHSPHNSPKRARENHSLSAQRVNTSNSNPNQSSVLDTLMITNDNSLNTTISYLPSAGTNGNNLFTNPHPENTPQIISLPSHPSISLHSNSGTTPAVVVVIHTNSTQPVERPRRSLGRRIINFFRKPSSTSQERSTSRI